MPRWTNKWGAPDPLVQLLGRESYSRGDSVRSCTQLIDSPRMTLLKENYADRVEHDISDRIWALFGTAVHKLIEEGAVHSQWDLREERIFTEIAGWKVSGAIDCQLIDGNVVDLWDWKVTRCWAVKQEKRDWVHQLNTLAYFIEKEKGLKVRGLRIGALLRDWSRKQAEADKDYPQSPIHVVKVPPWPYEKREAYVLLRVRLHQEAEMLFALGEELSDCTPDEMWEVPTTYAVQKKDGKRASKVFDKLNAAAKYAKDKGEAYEVIERTGERIRCDNYCEAAPFCSQRIRNASKAG